MGEATYYFKAEFETEEQAEKSLPEFEEYLTQHKKAYDDWQDKLRGNGNPNTNLNTLKKKYPLAMKFVKIDKLKEDDTHMNSLAGCLLDYWDTEKTLFCDGKTIKFYQEVWHFDDWHHLVDFAHTLDGCARANYVSDEYTKSDYF